MIFITVGTTQYKFKRLIDTAISIAKQYPREQFVIQSGTYTYKNTLPNNVLINLYFTFEDVQKYLKAAKLVVCHAGLGTILQTHSHGKKTSGYSQTRRVKRARQQS